MLFLLVDLMGQPPYVIGKFFLLGPGRRSASEQNSIFYVSYLLERWPRPNLRQH